jgi:hypothetical protein
MLLEEQQNININQYQFIKTTKKLIKSKKKLLLNAYEILKTW